MLVKCKTCGKQFSTHEHTRRNCDECCARNLKINHNYQKTPRKMCHLHYEPWDTIIYINDLFPDLLCKPVCRDFTKETK